MALYCEWKDGCSVTGTYSIPTGEIVPISIRVCAKHRAAWVESLKRRTRWPCAIEGCKRLGEIDGLCEPCWRVVRAHDELVKGEAQPALIRLGVRHAAKVVVPPVPTVADIEFSAKTADQFRVLSRSVAAHAGRAPPELQDDLDEASRLMSEIATRAAALATVQVEVDEIPRVQQRGLFDV